MSGLRQTYFGALNYYTQEFLVKAYKKGDSESTIAEPDCLTHLCESEESQAERETYVNMGNPITTQTIRYATPTTQEGCPYLHTFFGSLTR